jgi:hypothetical protein
MTPKTKRLIVSTRSRAITGQAIAASPTMPLEAAPPRTTEHHIHHPAVIEGERRVGMVAMRDVVPCGKALRTDRPRLRRRLLAAEEVQRGSF